MPKPLVPNPQPEHGSRLRSLRFLKRKIPRLAGEIRAALVTVMSLTRLAWNRLRSTGNGDSARTRGPETGSRVCAASVMGLGLLVMAGWVLGFDPFQRVWPHFEAMKFNVSLGFAMAGAALWWRHRPRLPLALGGLVALLGTLTLGEYLSGWDFGIDQFFIRETGTAPEAALGRMSPLTALCFAFCGAALVLTGGARRPPTWIWTELLAIAAGGIGFIALLGYGAGAQHLYTLPGFPSMPLHTATGFVLLAAGLLCAVPGGMAELLLPQLNARGAERLLWRGFGILILLLLVLGIVSVARLRAISANVESQAEVARPRSAAVRELEINVLDFGVNVRAHLAGTAEGTALAASAARNVAHSLTEYERLVETAQQRELAARFAAQWQELRARGEESLAAGRASPEELENQATLRMALAGFLKEEMGADATAAYEAAKTRTVRAIHLTGWITLLMLVAGIVVALATGGAVARGVLAAQQTLREQEEALRESGRLLRQVIDLVPHFIFAKDRQGRYLFLNQAAAAAYARTPGEITGSNERDVAPSRECAEAFLKDDREVIESGVPKSVPEEAIAFADGSVHYLETVKVPFTPAGSNETAVLGVAVDVTERKRTEAALRESEERLAALVENLTEGLVIGDSRGYLFHWNPAALAMHGYASPGECLHSLPEFAGAFELRSEKTGSLVPVEDWPLSRILRGETLRDCELRVRRLDQGGEKTFAYSGSRVCSASGEQLAILSITDVTARKQAEAERQKFVSLADQSLEFIGMCDLDFKPFYVNEAGRRLIGLGSLEHACSVRVQDCFFPEDQGMITGEFFPRVVREGRGETVVRFRHFQTGEALWMVYNVFQVMDEAGRLAGYATVSRDITTLRRVEDALRQAAQFPAQNPDPVLRIDCSGALLYANPPGHAWLASLGWQPGSALPEAVLAVAAEADEQPSKMEREITSPAGTTLSILAIRPPGEPYVNFYGRDITARKQAEAELAASQLRFAGIVESAMDAIITIGEDQRILLFNQAAETMFRCPAAEAIGSPVDRFLPGRFRDAHREHVRRFGESGVTTRTTNRHGGPLSALRADGEEFPMEASISNIEVGGARLFTVILRDVTERMRAEDSLKASLLEKEVLLKEIHHRVKNNMQVISSLASLQAVDVQDPVVHSALQDISDRVLSMALVHESLYESPNLARVDFPAYARNLLAYLWRAYVNPEKEISLHYDMDLLQLPVDVAVPCGLVLNELAANALKHAFTGRDRGNVTVTLRRNREGRVRLGVRDDGVGLPEGLEWQTARSLGLRLVGMLARQLHAEVEVAGVCPGGGTEFALEFEVKTDERS